MNKKFIFFSKLSLILVLFVILAGSLVRMTGSGMGCPDWPKCFGYYIPPTEISEIQFQPKHHYKSGQVLQYEDVFYYAKENFTSALKLDLSNWEINTQHSYNTFNVIHTWIEYINRLLTAFAGIPILILLIISLNNFPLEISIPFEQITISHFLSIYFLCALIISRKFWMYWLRDPTVCAINRHDPNIIRSQIVRPSYLDLFQSLTYVCDAFGKFVRGLIAYRH